MSGGSLGHIYHKVRESSVNNDVLSDEQKDLITEISNVLKSIEYSVDGDYASEQWRDDLASFCGDWQGGFQTIEETDNTQDKGDRNESEAVDLLSSVYGKSCVDKVYRYASNDPFGLADIIGMKTGWPLRVVQVKTNSFTAKDKKKYQRHLRDFPHEYAVFEVWVREDYEGWRMCQYNPDTEEFEEFLHMDTCDYEETVEALRQSLDFYEKIE